MDNQNQSPQDPNATPGQSPVGAPTTPPATPTTPPPAAQTSAAEPASSSALGQVAGAFSSIMGAIFSWIIFPIAVVLILHNFVFQAYHVLGTSMVPTLHETDYLIISKLGYTESLVKRIFGQNSQYIPARGEIIVFRYPKDPTKVFVKRVIGIPGDRVVIKNGTVTIFNKEHPNGFNPDTKYEKTDTTTLIDTDEVVQDGNLFVMGDNRTPSGSYDSREWGELPSSYIIGHAVLRLLPLDQVRFL
jgi:signal peptidase I